jgi:hypothetical protein
MRYTLDGARLEVVADVMPLPPRAILLFVWRETVV